MLLKRPKEFERVARQWAIKYAGAPDKTIAEGSGGVTDASIKEQAKKAKEKEAQDALAAYASLRSALLGHFI